MVSWRNSELLQAAWIRTLFADFMLILHHKLVDFRDILIVFSGYHYFLIMADHFPHTLLKFQTIQANQTRSIGSKGPVAFGPESG